MSRDPMQTRDEFSNTTAQKSNQEMTDLKDRVSDMTSKVKDKAGQVAETVSEKLSEQRTNAADTLGRAASALRDRAPDIPGGPKVINLTHDIADGMKSTAAYLRGHDFSQM